MEWLSDNEEQTFAAAWSLGRRLCGGECITLEGDLGTGKTVFAKGVAKGLMIDEPVLSPTFTIVREYQGRLKLSHFDVYRIMDPDEMLEIGFDEYFDDGSVCMIEWASNIKELLPEVRIDISIFRIDDERRRFVIKSAPKYEQMLKEVFV